MDATGATHQPRMISFNLIELGGVIGSGAYGEVIKGQMFEGELKTNPKTVALKCLRGVISSDLGLAFDKEAGAMSALDHNNILKLLGVTCSSKGTRYMIFEYMVNGSLDAWLEGPGRTFGVLDDNTEIHKLSLVDIGLQLADGMAYMAAKKFVHRDLAARNVLLADDLRVKISDFGLARHITADEHYEMGAGSVYPIFWTAPESMETRKFTSQSDVWSFGVLLWEIFSYGKLPYEELDFTKLKEELRKGTRLNQPESCPQTVYDLMKKCWDGVPDNRPSFQAILKYTHGITEAMLQQQVLHKWSLWKQDPNKYKPALGEWEIKKLPADIRKRWGLEKWPIPLFSLVENINKLHV